MFKKSNIKWKKLGLILKPNKKLWWFQSHAMVPTPEVIKDNIVKLYFSGRDISNRSHIGFIIIDLNYPHKIIKLSQEPILKPGSLGCFDDNGVTPSCVINHNKKKYLYYIGWNPGSTTRMNIFGGLSISTDNGNTFDRWSRAPIIERNKYDPFINTAPWVIKKNKSWTMYYVSGEGWINKDRPLYNIKIGFSKDGKNWERRGKICIDYKNSKENALARPYVIKDEQKWKMWFSYKSKNYKIGYAESKDGINWKRKDHLAGIKCSKNGFDSDMIEYASVIKYKDKFFMFYNGNNYGYDGIGLAIGSR